MTSSDVAALLAGSPFAGQFAAGAPLVVAAGQPLRVEFANQAALALFGAPTPDALEAVAFGADSPGARRLRRLGETLQAGKPARMESLRFYASRRPLPIGLLCARIAATDWQDFLVLTTPPSATGADIAPPPSVAEPAVVAPAPVEPPAPRRFLWSLDAEERFGPPNPVLMQAFDCHAPNEGEALGAFLARVGLDPEGTLAAAVAARKTFSTLRLAWPEPDSASARIALLSATTVFDKGRRFAGFRGFALLTGETVPFAPKEAPPCEAAPLEPEAFLPAHDEPLAAEEPASPKVEPAPPERGAEIVVLRQAPHPQPGPNVIPIRPGALAGFAFPAEDIRRPDDRENVELTNDERDAFREIARALGARLPFREDRTAAPPVASTPQIEREETPATDSPENRNAIALLDCLPIGAMVLRAGEPLYLNRTMLDLGGYGDLAEFRAADGLAHMFRGRDVQTLAEESAGGAIPLITADDELIAVDANMQAVAWDGAPATLIALRRAREAESEAELRALERQASANQAAARDLEATLEAATDGVIGLDEAGRILTMSRAACALFGYELNEVAGESFLMLFAPQSQGEATARLEQIKRDGAPRPGPSDAFVGRDRRGQSIAITLMMARLAAPPSATRYCALIRDLSPWQATERKLETAREEAEQTSARKTDFLARISHEVRTPLHAILGFAEVMMEERFGSIGNDRYKDYIKDIHASAKHVMSLASDLLDLSKIEAGKLELEFAPVDANRIVRECVSLMQPQAAQERIIVRLSLFDKLPNVMADERSLRQILLNLMSNAVKFNEPGGQVIVSTAVDEAGHPVIRVRDTGAGMNEGELVAALEPFRQIGGAHRVGGAGLGLPLTKALAEANHAGFSIKSRKHQGTLVEVAFPTTQAAQ